jgi:hypothetical protein
MGTFGLETTPKKPVQKQRIPTIYSPPPVKSDLTRKSKWISPITNQRIQQKTPASPVDHQLQSELDAKSKQFQSDLQATKSRIQSIYNQILQKEKNMDRVIN